MITRLLKDKGGFIEWFFVLVVIMAFAIFALVLNKAWSGIEEPLVEGLSDNLPADSPVNVSEILGNVGDTTRNFSSMLPFLIIGLVGFILITAGAIMKHPVMIFVGLIVFAVVILLGVIYSNVYSEIAGSEGFSDVSAGLGIQNSFMDYLPTIIFLLALGIVGSILYGKSQSGGTGI